MILKRSYHELKRDSRVLREAKCLLKEGHDVSIVIYGDDLSKMNENLDGIKIKIVKINNFKILNKFNPFNSQSIAYEKRDILYVLYVFIGLIAYQVYKFPYFFRTLHTLLNENVDVYHAHDFETLMLGYISALIKNSKLVYDSHELWGGGNIKLRGKIREPYIYLIENFLIKKTDMNITVNESIARFLSRKYDVKEPMVIANFSEFSVLRKSNVLREKLSIEKKKKIVLYQGGIVRGRGLENLIRCSLYIEDIFVVIMGDGFFKKTLQKIIDDERFDRVKILDAVPSNVLLNYTTSADIGIAPIQNNSFSNFYSLPNKIGEFIMAEIPFAVSNFPEMGRLAIDENMGVVFDPEDIKSIVDAINELLDPEVYALKKKNILQNKKKYSWENESKKLIKLYTELDMISNKKSII